MIAGKIAFDEHVALEGTPEYEALVRAVPAASGPDAGSDRRAHLAERLLEVGPARLARLDAGGVAYAVLSLLAPGIQGIVDAPEAIATAQRNNDRVAERIAAHPERLGAFAALPMQDPRAAARELERCVRTLGFKGALVNGFTPAADGTTLLYYDSPAYRDFWATVADLDVPFYLHPRSPLPVDARAYADHPWLVGAPWGSGVEAATHALRLCGSGLFDALPTLKIALGHLGEMIPYVLWRVDSRMAFSARGYAGARPLGEVFRQHFHLTTCGNYSDGALRCALEAMGPERLYFSCDDPFESPAEASAWFDHTPVLTPAARAQIARTNALRLLKLPASGQAPDTARA